MTFGLLRFRNPEHMECLTLNLLTTTIVAPPSNASKWQMGFNSAFKGLSAVCNGSLQGRIRVGADQCFLGHEAYTIFGALFMKKNK